MSEAKKIRVKVFRFNPLKDKEPRYETYVVPVEEGTSVLNVLNYIYENIDSSLSYYYSCRLGLAACCAVMVNGKAVQACTTIAKEDMTIEPPTALGFRVIKDLIASDVLLNKRGKFSVATRARIDRARARDNAPNKFQKACTHHNERRNEDV